MRTIRMTTISAATMLAIAIVGCDQSEPIAMSDAAEWIPADAGIPPRPDASYENTSRDAEPGRVCFEPMTLPEAALPRCRAATRDCISACAEGPEGEACRNGCWAGDDTPRYTEGGADIGCNDCIFQQLLGCLDRDGCEAQVAAFYCCVIDRCSMGGEGCVGEMCAAEVGAMFACAGSTAPQCFMLTEGDIEQCYADSDDLGADAGTPDGGAA